MRIAIGGPDAEASGPAADILLLPGRAALLPASRTLLVADLHLGKAATFRQAGIPVPEGSAQHDLSRLESILGQTGARRLVVLGDLFHAASGCTPAVFAEFAAFRGRLGDITVRLVVGNHDRRIGALPPALGIDSCLRSVDEPPLHLVHDPATRLLGEGRSAFTICGHIHPTVSIGAAGDRITDRCFMADSTLLVLPAFGSFTGGHRISPAAGQRFWIARDDGVAEVTQLATP